MTDNEQVRPEVVAAYFKAISNMDPAALAGITNMTPAEKTAAENLLLATTEVSADHHDRQLQVWAILAKTRFGEDNKSWAEIVNLLNPDDIADLLELSTALPDPLRAELARRGYQVL